MRHWASVHPEPDTPLLQLFGADQQYSPREIAAGLTEGTPFGLLFLRMLEHASTIHTVDYVAGSFEELFRSRGEVAHAAK